MNFFSNDGDNRDVALKQNASLAYDSVLTGGKRYVPAPVDTNFADPVYSTTTRTISDPLASDYGAAPDETSIADPVYSTTTRTISDPIARDIPPNSSLTDPAQLALTQVGFGDRLLANFFGTSAFVNGQTNSDYARFAANSYPSPLPQNQIAQAFQDNSGTVEVPTDNSESTAATAARGLGALFSGRVSLSNMKGEIIIVSVALIILILGIYAAVK